MSETSTESGPSSRPWPKRDKEGWTRPNLTLPTGEKEWLEDWCKRHGKKLSEWVLDKIREEQKGDTSDPVEVQRRNLLNELEKLEGQLDRLQDFEKNPRLRRCSFIFKTLTTRNAPKGPYADWGVESDWNALNRKAVEDYRKGAEWGKTLQITRAAELDRAFDWAMQVRDIRMKRRELERALDALRDKLTEPESTTQNEGSPGPALEAQDSQHFPIDER